MQHVGFQADGGLQLHARLQEAAVAGDGDHLRSGLTSQAPMAQGRATPMVCWPLEIITPAGAEAVLQVAGNPDMEAAHVHGQRDVAVDDVSRMARTIHAGDAGQTG